MILSDSEDYEDSDAEEDLSIRSLEVTKSPSQNDLIPLLECPVCFDLPLPPIRTCCRGHIICAECCPKLSLCPLCQQFIGTGRNFFAEAFLNRSVMKCKYHEDGCLVELPGSEIRGHMDVCLFRPLKCRECFKKVAYTDIDEHLLKEHKISKWDLNEDGARIILCQKLRTRNPYAALVDDSSTIPTAHSSVFLLLSLIIAFIMVDYYYFESSENLSLFDMLMYY